MPEQSFIKLYRSLLDWEWYQDGNTLRVFLHLLLKANVSGQEFDGVRVKRGQRILSARTLGEELNMSRQEVRTALNHLEKTGEIAIKNFKKYSVVTINNYEKFQSKLEPKAESVRGKGRYGKLGNVRLTFEEYNNLKAEFANLDDLINNTDKWLTENRSSNHYKTILSYASASNWEKVGEAKPKREKPQKAAKFTDADGYEYTLIDGEYQITKRPVKERKDDNN